MPTNSYQVISHEWKEGWNQFWTIVSSYRTFEEALDAYDSMEITDDIPEVTLEYHQNSGCYLQKIRPLLHKEWDAELCEVVEV